MNISLTGKLMCVGKKSEKSSDGKTTFYSMAVATEDGEAGNLSCTEEVFNSIESMNVYTCHCVYRDGQYKGLRVIAAFSNDSAPEKAPEKKSSNNK